MFEEVLAEFKSRYVLEYAPAGVSARGWRPVDVRLTERRATVLARRGYFVE